jgi:hypothetical protein
VSVGGSSEDTGQAARRGRDGGRWEPQELCLLEGLGVHGAAGVVSSRYIGSGGEGTQEPQELCLLEGHWQREGAGGAVRRTSAEGTEGEEASMIHIAWMDCGYGARPAGAFHLCSQIAKGDGVDPICWLVDALGDFLSI